MLFTMMQKMYPVLDFSVKNGKLHSIEKIHNEARVPLNLVHQLTEEQLEKWLLKRSIPLHRPYYHELYKKLFRKNFWSLLAETGGFNLSDQYWFREDTSSLQWQENNYFTNDFSNDIGNYLTIHSDTKETIDYMSPDLFTNGNNPKTWRKKDGQLFLLKGSLTRKGYDCINEKIIADYINAAQIPFLTCPATILTSTKGQIFSCSTNFITPDIELVPAHYLMDYEKCSLETEPYDHLLAMCEKLHVPDVKAFLNSMLAIDSILCQSDRHLGNFGFLRNVDTLEFIGPAPLYDNGSCLWYQNDMKDIGNSLLDANCKPFAFFHKQQNYFIESADILQYFDMRLFKDILYQDAGNLMEKERIQKMIKNVQSREHDLEKTLKNKNKKKERELELMR